MSSAETRTEPPLLAVRGARKAFGATQAVRDVSLDIHRGEIVALLGENGAGKSTLIKLMAGVHPSDHGTAMLQGTDLFSAPAGSAPVAFIHQDLGLIEWMTVAENICLGLGYPRRRGMIDWAEAERRAAAALQMIGVGIDPDLRIQTLDRTEKSLVAIARALASNAALIVLDEPTASLPADDVERLFTGLRRLKGQGVGMIYVSHRIDEVFEIADRMVVMRDGAVVGDRLVAETTPEETIALIVGQEQSRLFARPAATPGPPRLVLRDFAVADVAPVSLEFRRGEVVGLVGLRGAGQETVARGLFGLEGAWSGDVRLDGKPITIPSPRAAIDAGILLICGDRLAHSVVPTLSVRENLYLNPCAAGGVRPWSYLVPAEEDERARRQGASLHLRPNDPSVPIESLSGGNQQKVVVGRWLHLQGKVYLFEDPTAGVDVGAKAEIYGLFAQVVALDGCIVVISTDFEEVANICHRAIVFDRKRVVAELRGDDLTVAGLLAASSAGSAPGPATHISLDG